MTQLISNFQENMLITLALKRRKNSNNTNNRNKMEVINPLEMKSILHMLVVC